MILIGNSIYLKSFLISYLTIGSIRNKCDLKPEEFFCFYFCVLISSSVAYYVRFFWKIAIK